MSDDEISHVDILASGARLRLESVRSHIAIVEEGGVPDGYGFSDDTPREVMLAALHKIERSAVEMLRRSGAPERDDMN